VRRGPVISGSGKISRHLDAFFPLAWLERWTNQSLTLSRQPVERNQTLWSRAKFGPSMTFRKSKTPMPSLESPMIAKDDQVDAAIPPFLSRQPRSSPASRARL
jgi:hypothetical protein